MASEWQRRFFGDLVNFVAEKDKAQDASLATYISTENMLPNFGGITVAATLPNSGNVTRFRTNDTLFSNIRTYFKKVWQAEFNGHCSNDVLVFRPHDENTLLSSYLHNLSRWEKFTEFSVRTSKGAKMPRGDKNAFAQFQIVLPPLEEQRAITEILGSFDEKIELNRRMNETLEAMARALFKAWFVDFEPVRAKLSGRWRRGQSLPGLPAHLYDLFPDRLVESELGEIPERWEIGTLGDVAEHPRRSIQPSEIASETPYIALEHMPKRCIALSEWGVANALESNKYEFKRGEILFGKLRPYFHKVGIAPVDGVCSTDIVVIAPKANLWFGFVLSHVSSDAFVEFTNAGSTGTKMPRTSWSEMSRYEVVLPPAAISIAFNKYMQTMTEIIITKVHESKSLANLRDVLLPKLISGKLRIGSAEAVSEQGV